jgi:hypothetical protein
LTLADAFDRELAAMPKNATRRYIADRLAKLAETQETQAPIPKVHLTGLEESELLQAEFHRKNDQIQALRDEVDKLRAELGETL